MLVNQLGALQRLGVALPPLLKVFLMQEHADNTTLMAESEKELKNLLMKVK